MKSNLSRVIVVALLGLGIALGGSASAGPTSDRVCAFVGFNPIVFIERCLDVPEYPSVPSLPSSNLHN